MESTTEKGYKSEDEIIIDIVKKVAFGFFLIILFPPLHKKLFLLTPHTP